MMSFVFLWQTLAQFSKATGDGLPKNPKSQKPSTTPSLFPWRMLFLSLLRLARPTMSCLYGNAPLLIRSDGTSTGENYWMDLFYSFRKTPVLSLTFYPVSFINATTLGLFLSAVLAVNFKSANKTFLLISIVLATQSLLLSAIELMDNLESSLNYSHRLLERVGVWDSTVFLLITLNYVVFQWYLWIGGLEYQKRLMYHWELIKIK